MDDNTDDFDHLTTGHIGDMRRPELEPVKNMCRVDDSGSSLLALVLQEAHELCTAQHVQIHGDLIQKQDLGTRNKSSSATDIP